MSCNTDHVSRVLAVSYLQMIKYNIKKKSKWKIQMYHNENKFYDFYVTCYIQGQINLSISTTPSAFQIQQNKGLNHCFSTLTPWRQKLLNFYSLIKTILTYISQKTERVIFQNYYIYIHIQKYLSYLLHISFSNPGRLKLRYFPNRCILVSSDVISQSCLFY